MDEEQIIPEETGDHDRLIQVNIEEEMKTAYIDYSMSVIVGRALPDIRDGFKPVHRRVLYGMNELGNNSNKPTKKSARIVGEVMGKFHPHGDSSIYDTLVRLAQPFTMRYPLVEGQGNMGTQDGDPPAAMRYTEVRLDKRAESMLDDIDKETVDFQNNFDDSLQEPTVLPTRIPQLLVNGSSGIAVGMATNMMPHNLTEAIDGCIAYIDNKDITIEELMEYVKAPDFPTGGIIFGMEGVRQGMLTGRGRVVVRGKYTIERKDSGREKIIITEVPYQVSLDALTDKIGQLANDKIVEGIAYVNNESSQRDGTRIVVDLKKDAVAEVVVNKLFKYSELQTSFGINNIAISKGRPKQLNLHDIISEFVEFRMDVVTRRTQYELRKAKERAHILEGYMKVIGTQPDLDRAIRIIRESATPDEARTGLMEAFELSEIQARAILELRLRTLTGLEIDKIRSEYEELMKTINHLQELLDNEGMRYDLIKTELTEIKEKFGDERRSTIQYLADEISIEDLIEKEDVIITISNLGYLKRTSATEYRSQSRGGKGSKGVKTREEDFVVHLFVASTHDTMMFFTEQGRCYWLKVYEIPEGDKTSKGRVLQNLMQIPSDDKVRAIINVKDLKDKEFVESHNIVLCTKKGIIKKTSLVDFSRPRANGVNAITINDGDQLLEARITNGNNEIMLAVKSGRAIRFPESKVRVTGRGAIGVTGIEVDDEKDEVIGMICVNKEDTEKTVLVISEKGFGKRTRITDDNGEDVYRITNRGGKGVKTINITEKTGSLIGILDVTEKEDLIVTCKSGITLRTAVSKIKEAGRNTQGVIVIRVDGDDAIAAISKIEEKEEPEETITEGDTLTETGDTTPESPTDTTEENPNEEDNLEPEK
ncbi:MAG: DNA gyrase subunit A [Pseudopedobacter saltans]|uniref:DNA gyrase subunit A n=1 Tax=Pseudopedobacter saltans TaxID=151895 RepID=A0A2W5F6E3_9SPHI|nr:MAG: DNA gyrase subunit A [Pseudopedobacter saltans]